MGILEALSYGIPVLITKGTNMSNVIKKYNAGWTCETNSDDITNTLEKVLNFSNEIPKMSFNCIKLAETYAWDSIAKKTHNELSRLLKKEKR